MAGRVLVKKLDLQLLDGIEGRLHLRGEVQELSALRATGQKKVRLTPEDWGVLYLDDQPQVRLVVQCVRRERVGPMPSQTLRDPIWGIILICGLFFGGFKLAADLLYKANMGDIEQPDVSDRMAQVMFNKPPEEEEEEDPTVLQQGPGGGKGGQASGRQGGQVRRPQQEGSKQRPQDGRRSRADGRHGHGRRPQRRQGHRGHA